jgi:hypothetical protein
MIWILLLLAIDKVSKGVTETYKIETDITTGNRGSTGNLTDFLLPVLPLFPVVESVPIFCGSI